MASGVLAELLQERFLLFQKMCDRVCSIRDQIIADTDYDSFALKEVRIRHKDKELPEEPKVAKNLLEEPEQEPNLGKFVLPAQVIRAGQPLQGYLSFNVHKPLEQQKVIDEREGQTIPMTVKEKVRWDEIEAEHERQRAIIDARLRTPPRKIPSPPKS